MGAVISVAEPRLTMAAACQIRGGTTLNTGAAVPARQVTARIGWLIELAQELTGALLTAHWNVADIQTVTGGVDGDGVDFPSSAWMMMRRLNWNAPALPGVYVSDRVLRTAQEAAGRQLRGAAHRDPIIAGINATWPAGPMPAPKATGKYRGTSFVTRNDEQWAQLWKAVPPGTTTVEVRNRTRQVAKFTDANPGVVLPDSVIAIEQVPKVSPMLLLSAADRQLFTIVRTGPQAALLTVHLPTVARPTSRADWTEVAVPIVLPAHIHPDDQLHPPTLRLRDGRILADVSFSRPFEPAPRDGHTRALSSDWGINTILAASVLTLDADLDAHGLPVVRTDGRPLFFNAPGVQAKLSRLRVQREMLAPKLAHNLRLLTGLPATGSGPVRKAALTQRIELLQNEIAHVNARQRRLGNALSRSAARWLVDQAVAHRCTVIYLEELSTMEARGLGRKTNTRMNESSHGDVAAAVRHQAAKSGIAVVTVPARDTSRLCPRCLGVLTHTKASDNRRSSVKWASCGSCGFSADRDHSSADRIGSRGLAGQHLTRRTKAKTLTIDTAVDVKVRISRVKKDRPTPTRTAQQAARSAPACSTPVPGTRWSRSGPAPAPAGQRPAGPQRSMPHTPTGMQLRDTMSSTERDRPDGKRRTSRARLCFGFPPHVRASAIQAAVQDRPITPTQLRTTYE